MRLRNLACGLCCLPILVSCGSDVPKPTVEVTTTKQPTTTSTSTTSTSTTSTSTTTMPTTTTTTSPSTTSPPTTAPAVVASGSCAIPDYICDRESNHDPTVVSPNGIWHGKYQFTQSTWDNAVAGAGHPEYVGVPPEQAPEAIQDAAAGWLWSQPGGCGHWGAC